MVVRRTLAAFGALAIVSGFSLEAGAVQAPPHLASQPVLEVAAEVGAVARAERDLMWYRTPASARDGWADFVAEMGPRALAVWDPATLVPARAFGAGSPRPAALPRP